MVLELRVLRSLVQAWVVSRKTVGWVRGGDGRYSSELERYEYWMMVVDAVPRSLRRLNSEVPSC